MKLPMFFMLPWLKETVSGQKLDHNMQTDLLSSSSRTSSVHFEEG